MKNDEKLSNKRAPGAKVALFGFAGRERGKLEKIWQALSWKLVLPWQQIGKIKEYVIEYVEIPWQEQDFANFSLEQQREIFFRILLDAKKRGAIIAGMPMNWRIVLGNKAPVAVAEGKDIAIKSLLGKLEHHLGGLEGQQIAVIGVEESWNKRLVDALLAAGAEPILTGSKGNSLAEYYFQVLGIAIPVMKGAKAIKASRGGVILNGISAKGLQDKLFAFQETNLKLAGDWGKPFADGYFPCGLASAILTVGGERDQQGFLTKSIEPTLVGKEKLA